MFFFFFVNKLDKEKLFFPGSRCVNGGTCIDGIDEYSCSCPPQITGMSCECLMLDNGELDCNFTSDFTPFMSSTSEIYQTTIAYTTSPIYSVDDLSSTDISDVATEIVTEKTESTSMEYGTSELTTMTSTVELITNTSFTTSENNFDATTTANTVYSTTEYISDVSRMLGSTNTTESGTISSVASETASISSTTTDYIYKSTTDYNPIVVDTTLSNSFFTDYPIVKTNTESTVTDDQRSIIPIETTTEYVTPTTTGSDTNITTVEPKTPVCSNKMCQNGGTCVPTPKGAKVGDIISL